MTEEDRAPLGLTEFETKRVPASELTEEEGGQLWREYKTQLDVEFPSPKTDGMWEITAQGYVGYVPVSTELGILLQPKVDLGNLFRMLEYAYRLDFALSDDLIALDSLTDFFERLAHVLAKRTLDRAQKGLHRSYVPRTETLPYVRGRFDLTRRLRQPWKVRPQCSYQEHTADIEDNQILAWTLRKVARSGACGERVLPAVRRAYRLVQGATSLEPFSPDACVDRLYNRLNHDYAQLHALCRFFLEHTGPTFESGENRMLPFLVSMSRLFELFVAEWLKDHLPPGLGVRAQQRVRIGEEKRLAFQIDLVLVDEETGEALAVLDTKYKAAGRPEASDVEQIVAYAHSKGCEKGFLLYPKRLSRQLDEQVGDIRVRSLIFDLSGDLEENGGQFLDRLLSSVNTATVAGGTSK